ncbi:hypothetical protein [Undibacterium sp. Ren11W]|uniref:DUF7832 domain-containing protein n=1 Tax=Undibacterium sp. Ren11W TaxID=3413045 RepID=UPI003BEFA3F3
MTKLDDTSWHLSSEEFSEDLPEENSATHIGMFVAWAIHNDLWGEIPGGDWAGPMQQVRKHEISGSRFVLEQCDGKLFSEMLNEKGALFAGWYYDHYTKDYQCTLAQDLESDYHVSDTRENYERMAGVLSAKYKKFTLRRKPWWKFW